MEGVPNIKWVTEMAVLAAPYKNVYAEIGTTNAAWKKIYEDFSAFRRDQNLWFRFTEAGFDDFMQSQKL